MAQFPITAAVREALAVLVAAGRAVSVDDLRQFRRRSAFESVMADLTANRLVDVTDTPAGPRYRLSAGGLMAFCTGFLDDRWAGGRLPPPADTVAAAVALVRSLTAAAAAVQGGWRACRACGTATANADLKENSGRCKTCASAASNPAGGRPRKRAAGRKAKTGPTNGR